MAGFVSMLCDSPPAHFTITVDLVEETALAGGLTAAQESACVKLPSLLQAWWWLAHRIQFLDFSSANSL